MVELIVVHIPKTAGGAFQSILQQVYGVEYIYYDYGSLSIPQVYSPTEIPSPPIRVIHGHFPIDKYDSFCPNAKRIIWFRHPIHLLISLYFYWRHMPRISPDDTSIVGKTQHTKMGIYEFAEQPEVTNILSQNMCGKQLTDFYFVGFQEFFNEDILELKKLLSWPDINVSIYQNVNPNLKYHQDVQAIFTNKTIMSKLVENNREDIEKYHDALNLRAKRRKEPNLLQPIMAEWNREKYRLSQILKSASR